MSITAPRDPEDRRVDSADQAGKREKMFDKTIADSFPASDAPSFTPTVGTGLRHRPESR